MKPTKLQTFANNYNWLCTMIKGTSGIARHLAKVESYIDPNEAELLQFILGDLQYLALKLRRNYPQAKAKFQEAQHETN